MIKYDQWINEYKKRVGNVKGKCESATKEMQIKFPELIRKRGHVEILYKNRKLAHWWLITSNGVIIDPTASQFDIIMDYIEHDETQPEPIGKCLNCGEYVFEGSTSNQICSEKCNNEFVKSLYHRNL